MRLSALAALRRDREQYWDECMLNTVPSWMQTKHSTELNAH